ncbi:hypothetical protein HZC09_00015 [Candidatus Micrarchaeota archaeon]|nr:hypothetical protein [Candidatus Micrarchaeota archaeon]
MTLNALTKNVLLFLFALSLLANWTSATGFSIDERTKMGVLSFSRDDFAFYGCPAFADPNREELQPFADGSFPIKGRAELYRPVTAKNNYLLMSTKLAKKISVNGRASTRRNKAGKFETTFEIGDGFDGLVRVYVAKARPRNGDELSDAFHDLFTLPLTDVNVKVRSAAEAEIKNRAVAGDWREYYVILLSTPFTVSVNGFAAVEAAFKKGERFNLYANIGLPGLDWTKDENGVTDNRGVSFAYSKWKDELRLKAVPSKQPLRVNEKFRICGPNKCAEAMITEKGIMFPGTLVEINNPEFTELFKTG